MQGESGTPRHTTPVPDGQHPPPQHHGDRGDLTRPPAPDRHSPTAARRVTVELPPDEPDPTLLPVVALDPHAPGGPGERLRAAAELGLEPDELLGDQYQVVRKLGYGGLGQVFLAHDTRVDGREVAIKLLHQHTPVGARGILLAERRSLVELNHPDLIRVFNFGSHPSAGEFLVLEYVDGLELDEVRAQAAADPALFGGARFHEFVLAYGVRVLSALAYLHEGGRVYGDLKPQNVMHGGPATKMIDLGSVRAAEAPGPFTGDYAAPGVDSTGRSQPADDLFSLGETLRVLSGLGGGPRGRGATGTPGKDPHPLDGLVSLNVLRRLPAPVPEPDGAPGAPPGAGVPTAPVPQGLGLVSLARVLHRATRPDRADRFASAGEMEQQLRGVFRELRSLRLGVETFEPSPLFRQAPYALDGGLGAAPPVSDWAAGTGDWYTLPRPPEVARRLPVPRPDPRDRHHAELERLTDDDPRALLQLTGDLAPPSPELLLLRCRLELRTAAETAGVLDVRAARALLDEARRELGPNRAVRDWRVDWHQGLLALGGGQVTAAQRYFDLVYAAIPGEYAPKLALGYCFEHAGDRDRALHFHEAVRVRNPSLGGAAFGAARALLAKAAAREDDPRGAAAEELRARAVAALDAVPQHSRHRTAACTAALRVKVQYAGGAAQLPEVLRRLRLLFDTQGLTDAEARLRLGAEVWGRVQELLDEGRLSQGQLAEAAAGEDGRRLGFPSDGRELRISLSEFFRAMARQAARSAADDRERLAERLLDRAYAVRPLSLWHHRGPRTGRRPR
ncbi:tetratricopeptide repeat protein [Streptomyces sp. NPDC058045]|uniref:tetratricopeptide repeat protein n=1 Tax=Streptomyces sp. NPDC058045 TaxID=3346311 RepID=UPI0036E96E68